MENISRNVEKIYSPTPSAIMKLCTKSPFLIINTPCGIGKYVFNKIGYNNKRELTIEYKLITDNKYKDTSIIEYKIGNYYYLSATQVLYAIKYFASS